VNEIGTSEIIDCGVAALTSGDRCKVSRATSPRSGRRSQTAGCAGRLVALIDSRAFRVLWSSEFESEPDRGFCDDPRKKLQSGFVAFVTFAPS